MLASDRQNSETARQGLAVVGTITRTNYFDAVGNGTGWSESESR